LKLVIDLFSGLGGASESFLRDPKYAVIRYDNNPLLMNIPCTTICDLTNYQIKIRHKVDLVWASPPCLDFSRAYNAPGPQAERENIDFEPNLNLLKKSIELIEELNPTHWIIENVVGSIKHFEPFLGQPRQIIGPFVLWGNFPLIDVPRDFKHTKADVDERWSPIRSNVRAKIPFEISAGLKTAIESQTKLDLFSHLSSQF
jgi:hypothetical protein